MILAYKSGTLISVKLIHKHPITTIVVDADNKQFCYRENDAHRKLFAGENAVYDAIEWIEQQRGITIKGNQNEQD